jgi:hypothetical protein
MGFAPNIPKFKFMSHSSQHPQNKISSGIGFLGHFNDLIRSSLRWLTKGRLSTIGKEAKLAPHVNL